MADDANGAAAVIEPKPSIVSEINGAGGGDDVIGREADGLWNPTAGIVRPVGSVKGRRPVEAGFVFAAASASEAGAGAGGGDVVAG